MAKDDLNSWSSYLCLLSAEIIGCATSCPANIFTPPKSNDFCSIYSRRMSEFYKNKKLGPIQKSHNYGNCKSSSQQGADGWASLWQATFSSSCHSLTGLVGPNSPSIHRPYFTRFRACSLRKALQIGCLHNQLSGGSKFGQTFFKGKEWGK